MVISNIIITVIVPLFNCARYIERSLRSILRQSFQNFEIIVVDDGSTDGGGGIATAFDDSRIKVVRQDNMGVSAARNKGISVGQGEFCAFLDADDEWEIEFLEAVVNLSRIYPKAGIYGTGYKMMFPDGPVVDVTAMEASRNIKSLLIRDYFTRANGGSLINSSGVMIPRKIFNEIGTFKVGEHYGEDLEMWARIALRYPIGYDTRILTTYYQTDKANKKRLIQPIRYEPHVRMLEEVLKNKMSYNSDRQILESHIKNRYFKQLMLLTMNSNRNTALDFSNYNKLNRWLPLLSIMLKKKSCWPIIKSLAWVYKFLWSRHYIFLVGGRVTINKVLFVIKFSR